MRRTFDSKRSRIAVLLAAPAMLLAASHEEGGEVAEVELTEAHIAVVSSSGAAVLDEVSQARAAIAKGDGLAARKHVTRARARLGEAKSASPAERADHELGMVLGLVRNEKATSDDLVPIYAELDVISETHDVTEVRGHVDRAKGHLDGIGPLDPDADARWKAAGDELIEASSKLVYLEVDLPIHETYVMLRRAHQDLRHGKLNAADTSLAKVQESVQAFVVMAEETEVRPAVGAGPGD